MRQLVLASCAWFLNGLGASVALAAGPVLPEPPNALLPPPVALARVAAPAAAPNARPTAPRRSATRNAATAADSSPPVVSSFRLPPSFTMAKLGEYMPFTVKARDDLSGVSYVLALLASPSGNQQVEVWSTSFGETRLDRRSGQYLPPNLEPGLWQMQRLSTCDLASNCTEWTGTALQAIKGRQQVEVRNAFYDITPPTLSSGVLTLNWIDGSRGMVAATVAAQDTGNPRAAGVWSAQVELCREAAQGGGCLVLDGTSGLPDLTEASLRLGTWVDVNYTPAGLYHIKSVSLSDFNGAWHTYTSALVGGETNFGSLFNVTSLSI